MFTPSNFPCSAWCITPALRTAKIKIESRYHFHNGPIEPTLGAMFVCEGGWLLHSSELFENADHAEYGITTKLVERMLERTWSPIL